MGLGRGERLVERGPGVCVDRLSLTTLILSASGKSTLTRSRIRSAKSAAVRRWATVTLRQGRWASRATNRLTVPLGYTRSRSVPAVPAREGSADARSEEHTSELQSLMRISYAVFCLKKKQ